MKFPGIDSNLFTVEELVDKRTLKTYGQKAIWFIDERLIAGIFFLRQYYDAPMIINNWNSGGNFSQRGLRMSWSSVNWKDSQHGKGRAVDFNVVGLTSDKQAQMLIDDWEEIAKNTFFTTIENPDFTKGWTHLDGRWNNDNTKLLIVNP